MKNLKVSLPCCLLIFTTCFIASAQALETSGELQLQAQYFPQDNSYAEQEDFYPSIALNIESFHDWDNGNQRLTVRTFGRLDVDDRRTHADIRELYWRKTFPQYDLDIYIGSKKIFWGVVESHHLIDIINQVDRVEDIDNKQKLGQPMLQAVLEKNWGTAELYVLPYFREQRFPGNKSRFKLPRPIKTSLTEFESDKNKKHIDYAARWSYVLGNADMSLAYFQGTDRNPVLNSVFQAPNNIYFIPKYYQLKQTSVSFQYVFDNLLIKLEALHRYNQNGRSEAAVSGVEYTLSGVFDSKVDLGLVSEYQYDNENISKLANNDIVLGTRINFNDVQDTNILALVSFDDTNHSKVYSIEAERRIGSQWKGSLKVRSFSNTDVNDVGALFKNNDSIEIELTRFLAL